MKRKLMALAGGLILTLPGWGNNVPRPAPDLKIKIPGGATQQLSQYKGKVVALEFLLTTCSHCQKTSQVLSKIQQEYGPKGLQVIGIAINPMAQMAVPDFIKQFQLNFPVGYDEPDVANGFLQHPIMIRMLMPQLAFIDRAGIIRAQYGGDQPFFQDQEKNIRAKVEELLNEKPAAAKGAPPKTVAKKKTASR